MYVKMNPKSILLYTMESLGSKSVPVFSEIDCGDDGFKVSIKLDVSDLSTVNGNRISFSVVEGQPSFNVSLSETSAVMMAFNHLQQNRRIVDFSSRLAQRYGGYKMYDLVVEAMGSLEQMFKQWGSTLDHCENFAVKLVRKQFANTVAGHLTDKGKVYAHIGDSFSPLLNRLHTKSSDARTELNEVDADRSQYGNRMALKRQMLLGMACAVSHTSSIFISAFQTMYNNFCPAYSTCLLIPGPLA